MVKLVRFELADGTPGSGPRVGILLEHAVVDASEALAGLQAADDGQRLMQHVIDRFEDLRGSLERLALEGPRHPVEQVRLRAPLPRPGKILCCIGNYWEHMQREPRPLNMFLKSSDAVIGPGDTVVLPEFDEPYVFHHEAELAVVLRGPSKKVSAAGYRDAVFGYTGLIDVSARAEGRRTWRAGSWMGKSFDTFAPLGPCIVTADEIPDPNKLWVRFWDNGELRHDYTTDDMEHRVPELIEFASRVMTLNSGDVIACGTNHEGLGPLQDGDVAEIEIAGVGRMAVKVSDPLKRVWERGIYVGPDSTAPSARRS